MLQLANLNRDHCPSPALAELVEHDRLGVKIVSGFYMYGKADLRRVLAYRDRVLLGFLKVLDENKG